MPVRNAPKGPEFRARQAASPSRTDGLYACANAIPRPAFRQPARASTFLGLAFLVLTHSAVDAKTSATEGPPASERAAQIANEDNFLILEAQLLNFTLTDGMSGYLNEGSLLLPLSEFSEILDLAIGVSPGTGKADGWFLSENRLFSLDVNRGTVVIDGKTQTFNPLFIAIFSDDIYVDVRLLAQWFPIDIRFNLSNLLIRFETREPFPIEQQLNRKSRRTRLLSRKESGDSGYPKLPLP